jgi:hypothetical protein
MANALDPLEDAAHLLREAGLSTVVLHWIGSVPFAFGALAAWRSLTAPRVTEETCAAVAFALTLLLLWMSCWRAVFAIRLRSRVFRQPPIRWTVTLVLRLVRNQAVFAGFKLWVLPIAGLAVLPLPWVVAFFRNAAVYSDLDLSQSAARAQKLAWFEQTRNSVAILVLSALALLTFMNFALTLAMLPQLAKTFSGIESVYTRSGLNLVLQPLFFLSALFCTCLAMDPFIQAFYVVRCFRGDSVDTGADLRARLVAVGQSPGPRGPVGSPGDLQSRASLIATFALLLLVPAHPLAAEIDPGDLDRAVHRTLQSREYDWRLPEQSAGSPRNSWIVSFTDRMVAHARDALRTLAYWVDRLLKWLQGSNAPTPTGAIPGSELVGGLYLLIVLVLAGGAFALWRMRARRKKSPRTEIVTAVSIDLRDESLTADRLPEEQWYSLAEDCLRQRDLRAALRALFLANLAWLQSHQLIAIHHGKTNREYERELRRRGRAAPEASPLLSQNIDAFERAWYGLHPAGPEDIDQFRLRLQQMKELIPA